jgi:hypothetical protein
VPRIVKQLAVFAFVNFTWIFFRAPKWENASLIVERIFWTGWDMPLDPKFPLLLAALVLAVWIYQLIYTSQSPVRGLLDWPMVRIGLATGMVVYLLLLAQSSTEQFIYFQF